MCIEHKICFLEIFPLRYVFKELLAEKHVVRRVNCPLILSEFNNLQILVTLLHFFRGKHIFIALLEDWTLDVQEENRRNDFFSLGTGHELIFKLPGEEEQKSVQRFSI
jgi:hypothetical protein